MDKLINFSSLTQTELVKPTHKKNKSIKNISSVKKYNEITAKDIIYSLSLKYVNHKYLINNAYIFDWESDFFSLSDAGYVYEFEIKVTKSDYKDDFNKKDKHLLLENNIPDTFDKKPNKFWYAVPKGLIPSYEIPAYAGLIEISDRDTPANVIKEAPFLHKELLFPKYQKKLLDKFYWRYRDLLYRNMEEYEELLEVTEKNVK